MGRPRLWSREVLELVVMALEGRDNAAAASVLTRQQVPCPKGQWTERTVAAAGKAAYRDGLMGPDARKPGARAQARQAQPAAPVAQPIADTSDTEAIHQMVAGVVRRLLDDWSAQTPGDWQRELQAATGKARSRHALAVGLLGAVLVALQDRSPASVTRATGSLSRLAEIMESPDLGDVDVAAELDEVEPLLDRLAEALPILVEMRGLDYTLSLMGLEAMDVVEARNALEA